MEVAVNSKLRYIRSIQVTVLLKKIGIDGHFYKE